MRQAKCSLDGASAESRASDSNQKGIIGKWKDVGLRILDCIEATCYPVIKATSAIGKIGLRILDCIEAAC
ncbi:hypothetical protein C2U68_19750 [Methylomonas koyamae]|nr:hypothetical protein C2U68_19750 [Methylomonas koyamae]